MLLSESSSAADAARLTRGSTGLDNRLREGRMEDLGSRAQRAITACAREVGLGAAPTNVGSWRRCRASGRAARRRAAHHRGHRGRHAPRISMPIDGEVPGLRKLSPRPVAVPLLELGSGSRALDRMEHLGASVSTSAPPCRCLRPSRRSSADRLASPPPRRRRAAVFRAYLRSIPRSAAATPRGRARRVRGAQRRAAHVRAWRRGRASGWPSTSSGTPRPAGSTPCTSRAPCGTRAWSAWARSAPSTGG